MSAFVKKNRQRSPPLIFHFKRGIFSHIFLTYLTDSPHSEGFSVQVVQSCCTFISLCGDLRPAVSLAVLFLDSISTVGKHILRKLSRTNELNLAHGSLCQKKSSEITPLNFSS
uniref:Uncharacterized protein n=1 Tax=Cacopsylla melanoneura TaxID=428564 RepID=A0A8D8ZHY5_9HEMI